MDGENVIHIIGGDGPRDGADNRNDQPPLAKPGEDFQIPSLGSSSFMDEMQRSSKGRHCRKFYTQEGCPFGDKCAYFHDDLIKGRERTAILLGPASSVGYGNGGATESGRGPAPMAPPTPASAVSNTTLKTLSWKTRICHKWEQTAYCPFGSNCSFAHGAAELQRYGGGPVDDSNPNKQAVMSSKVVATTRSSLARGGGSGLLLPDTLQKPVRKWKGPDKISLIYGDWIEDIE